MCYPWVTLISSLWVNCCRAWGRLFFFFAMLFSGQCKNTFQPVVVRHLYFYLPKHKILPQDVKLENSSSDPIKWKCWSSMGHTSPFASSQPQCVTMCNTLRRPWRIRAIEETLSFTLVENVK